jgi:hypothetical protein
MSIDVSTRRLAIGGLTLGLALGAIGIAVARGGGDDHLAPQAAVSDMGTPGADASQIDPNGPGETSSAAIADVTAALSDAGVVSAAIVPTMQGAATDAPGVSITVKSDAGDGVWPLWLGDLAQGAIADRMRTDQQTTNQVISAGEIVDTNDGKPLTTGLGSGSVRAGQVFSSPSDAELTDRVNQVAQRFGLKVESAEVLHPMDSAVAVTFVVPDGVVDWTIDQLRAAVQGDPQSIEGFYLELRGPSGDLLLQDAGASRIGAGNLWFAPGQDERFSAVHGHAVPEPTDDAS